LLCCTEDYYRIGQKTLNTFLLGHTKRAAFTMKTDDDSFVHLSRLLVLLLAVPAGTTAYIGYMDCFGEPQRDGKWGDPEYKYETYPPWAHGAGFVASLGLASHIAERHRAGGLKVSHLEDVGFGQWVQEAKERFAMQVRLISDTRLNYEGIQEDCSENLIVVHYADPEAQRCLWKAQHNSGSPLCRCAHLKADSDSTAAVD